MKTGDVLVDEKTLKQIILKQGVLIASAIIRQNRLSGPQVLGLTRWAFLVASNAVLDCNKDDIKTIENAEKTYSEFMHHEGWVKRVWNWPARVLKI